MSQMLKKAGCRLLDASMEAMNFAFSVGSGFGIVGAVLVVFALSYVVAGAV